MTPDFEFDSAFDAWLEDGPTEMTDHAVRRLDAAIAEIDTRRPLWLPRRETMNRFALAATSVAVVVVAVVIGVGLLSGSGGFGFGAGPTASPAPSPTPSSTLAPSPTPTLLARGNFSVSEQAVALDAAGAGSDVTGSISATDGSESLDINLHCTRTTANGVILIGGRVTDSTIPGAPAGTWAGLVLQRGSPVKAVFVYQLDDPPAADCMAFLEQMIAYSEDDPFEDHVEPVEGTIEFGPDT